MAEPSPTAPDTRIARPPGPRRSTFATLKWPMVALLLLVIIAIATGLIPSGGGSSVPAAAPTASSGPTPNGWGPEAFYVGRYRLLAATEQRVGSAPVRIRAGSLTLFLRVLHTGAPLLPSGILTLQAPAPLGTELLYLTSLSSSRGVHHAVVNGGAFVGPVLGSLSATLGHAGMITLSGEVSGVGAVSATFKRFSYSPQP